MLVTVFFTLKNISYGNTKTFSGEKKYTFINNYIIFKNSYFHLKEGKNLYISYPEKQWDLYKYSPSFSAFMGILAYLPNEVGIMLWNLTNCLLIFFGIRYFVKGPPEVVFILWFILNEFITSVINSQSNPAIAGLLIMAFTFFEKEKVHLAALCIIATFYIKIFGILAALLFLFYPQKLKFLKWCFLWGVFIGLLPVFLTSLSSLIEQYKNWLNLLLNDHEGNYGYSFMGVLNSWFGLQSGKDLLVLAGLFAMVVPLFFINKINDLQYRTNWFAALLIWIVIFNHKAESPTFIIALCGVAIWFFNSNRNIFDKILFAFAFVFTSLAPTDVFPLSIRKSFFEPYAIKAVPCIVVWIFIMCEMIKNGVKKYI